MWMCLIYPIYDLKLHLNLRKFCLQHGSYRNSPLWQIHIRFPQLWFRFDRNRLSSFKLLSSILWTYQICDNFVVFRLQMSGCYLAGDMYLSGKFVLNGRNEKVDRRSHIQLLKYFNETIFPRLKEIRFSAFLFVI